MSKKKDCIAVGADHAGFAVKTAVVKVLLDQKIPIMDFGTSSDASTDYPDYALKVAQAVASGKCTKGILACGSGIGMSIAANKVRGIRAAVSWSTTTARLAAEHNWANILCVSGRFNTISSIKKMIQTWLSTPYERGGRHERRVKKILKIEAKIHRRSNNT